MNARLATPWRAWSVQLTARAGQPVIVDPRPGGGAIGVQAVLTAEADGHTLLSTGSSVLAEIPHVLPVPYNAHRPVAHREQSIRPAS